MPLVVRDDVKVGERPRVPCLVPLAVELGRALVRANHVARVVGDPLLVHRDLPLAELEVAAREQLRKVGEARRGSHVGQDEPVVAIDRGHAEVVGEMQRKVAQVAQALGARAARPNELEMRVDDRRRRARPRERRVHRLRIGAEQRVERLFREHHAPRFAAQVRKLDPRVHVVGGREHNAPHAQDALPHLDVQLAALQPLHPDRAHRRLAVGLVRIVELVRERLLQLGEHLRPHHEVVRTRIALAHQRRELRVQRVARTRNEPLRLVPLSMVDGQHGAVEGALARLGAHGRDELVHHVPLPKRPRGGRRERRHLAAPLGPGRRPLGLHELREVLPLAERMQAAHLAKHDLLRIGLLDGAPLVRREGLFPPMQLLVPLLMVRNVHVLTRIR